MVETVYIIRRHATITIRVYIIRVFIERHGSVLCSERLRDTALTCDSQCQTACRDIPILWHLVIWLINSFKILIIEGATSGHLCSVDALYEFTVLFITSILVLISIEYTLCTSHFTCFNLNHPTEWRPVLVILVFTFNWLTLFTDHFFYKNLTYPKHCLIYSFLTLSTLVPLHVLYSGKISWHEVLLLTSRSITFISSSYLFFHISFSQKNFSEAVNFFKSIISLNYEWSTSS